MDAMQWEVNWIRANKNQYDSDLHAESVIKNIEKKYFIKQLEQRTADLAYEVNKLITRNKNRYERVS